MTINHDCHYSFHSTKISIGVPRANLALSLYSTDSSVMPVPYDINVTKRTTRSITVGWKVTTSSFAFFSMYSLVILCCFQLNFIPPFIRAIGFRLNITAEGATRPRILIYRAPVTNTSRDFNYTISSLSLNTSHTLYLRAEGEYQWCPTRELVGLYARAVIVSTADSG